MFCPFKDFERSTCNKSSCALWVEDEGKCSVRLAAKSLSEISTAMMIVKHSNAPEPVEEDLPFC